MSNEFFVNKFHDLIIINSIVKYKRFLPFYKENQNQADDLIQEYICYANALSLSSIELNRKEEILKMLEEIDAERIRTACTVIDEESEVLQ